MKRIHFFKTSGYPLVNHNHCDIYSSTFGMLEANQQLLFIPEVTMG